VLFLGEFRSVLLFVVKIGTAFLLDVAVDQFLVGTLDTNLQGLGDFLAELLRIHLAPKVQAQEGTLEVLVKRNASRVESLRNRVSDLDCRDALLNLSEGLHFEELTDLLEVGHVRTLPHAAIFGKCKGTVGCHAILSLRNLVLVFLPQFADIGEFLQSEQGW